MDKPVEMVLNQMVVDTRLAVLGRGRVLDRHGGHPRLRVEPRLAVARRAFILAAFAGAIRGDANPAQYSIGVYQALDMFLPGLFAYRSILEGGSPVVIPNFWNDLAVDDPYGTRIVKGRW